MQVVIGLLLSLVSASFALLAATPPMGWMSWEDFRCQVDCQADPNNCINDQLYQQMADKLVSGGFLNAGYDTIHLDDCWMSRDRNPTTGALQPNATRFPNGFKALADYMHKENVKFAIYTAESSSTCGGYPASKDHEKIDVEAFKEWTIDYVKVDGCGNPDYYPTGYKAMGDALVNSGRDIVYSCSWPAYLGHNESVKPYDTFIADHCNLWRNFADIQCNWASLLGIIDHWGDWGPVLKKFAAPGHWNDPDMLLIGNDCITEDEARTQMAMWSIFAAPLIMGNDLRNLTSSHVPILLNKDAIAVNQDAKGEQGLRLSAKGAQEVWARNLSDGSVAVGLFNKDGDAPKPAPCPTWNHTEGYYFEACGGPGGNIHCFSPTPLEEAQEFCCNNSACAGFSYNRKAHTGCYKLNADCGRMNLSGYDGYYKPHFSPPTPSAVKMTVLFADIGVANSAKVLDIWTGKETTETTSYTTVVPFHGTAFLRITSTSEEAPARSNTTARQDKLEEVVSMVLEA
eukprot:m.49531 g.49531  ORF g.49531 m.49531 type:complete len:513 (+) comp17928_c0_seq1:21-1559(+)